MMGYERSPSATSSFVILLFHRCLLQRIKLLDDFGTDRTGPAPTGIDDHVCRFTVQGFTNLDQFLEPGQRIRSLKQWTGLVLAGALELLCYRSAQIHHYATLMQVAAALRCQDRPATRGKNNAGAPGQGIDHARLARPEALLALHIEYPGNIGTGDRLNFPVGIEEGHAELTGKHPADCALAHPHGADEKNAARIVHCPTESPRKSAIVTRQPAQKHGSQPEHRNRSAGRLHHDAG